MGDPWQRTGMEYGAITPVGLPSGWRVLVDAAVRPQPDGRHRLRLRSSKLASRAAWASCRAWRSSRGWPRDRDPHRGRDAGPRGRTARAPPAPPGGSGLALLFLLPALAIFAVFIFYPLVRSVVLSFQGVDIIGRPGALVGTANYARLFSDPGFLKVLGVTAPPSPC